MVTILVMKKVIYCPKVLGDFDAANACAVT